MKYYYFPILWIVLSVLFSSCEQHYTMLTEIRSDGSCLRQIGIITRDSAFLMGDTVTNPFPLYFSPNWQVEIKASTTRESQTWPLKQWSKGDSAYVTISRKFTSVEAMNHDFYFNRGTWKGIKPESSLKKSFRWFYTYYTFSETYPRISSTQIPVPLDKYMTKEEQEIWFQGNVQVCDGGRNGYEVYTYLENIEKKATDWMNHNLFMLNYAAIEEFFGNKNDQSFSGRIAQARDSVYANIVNNTDYLTNNLIGNLDSFFKTDYFSKEYNREKELFNAISDRHTEVLALFEPQFRYELTLPGKIISSNGTRSEQDKLIWQLNAYRFLPTDYTLTAESRRLNIWTVILSLLLAGGLIYRYMR